MRSLVTVIVPMYNEEKKVALCVDVLKKQTNQNFDVIFINDGSTDNTVKILKECLGLDTYFNYKIITQENQGAAAARENGIQQADTDFVYPCESKSSPAHYSKHPNLKRGRGVFLFVI
ncbi:glycosyltransferase family 2 protein [Acinetobacter nosocomialis]